MDLSAMLTLVRKDLHDEDQTNYRWTDAELERHIDHAVKDFSAALPLEYKATLTTLSGSREISIAGLTDIVMIEAAEYPTGYFPPRFQRFALWNDTLTLLGDEIPDGSDCNIYYGKLHTLDGTGSTIPSRCEDLVAAGAGGYAALQIAGYAIDRVNTGGLNTPAAWSAWGQGKINFFRAELKRLGKRNRVRVKQIYKN